jgi:hypothetical protein
MDALGLAKSYFDLKEYDRAAYFLRGCRSKKAYFLYMYSRYLVSWCFSNHSNITSRNLVVTMGIETIQLS